MKLNVWLCFPLWNRNVSRLVMMGCLSDLQTQGHEVSGSLRSLFLMLIMMVSLLGVGEESLQLLRGNLLNGCWGNYGGLLSMLDSQVKVLTFNSNVL